MHSSRLCVRRDFLLPEMARWMDIFRESPTRLHRKLWEYAAIAEALEARGMLEAGRKGLGFAVGSEPLADAFASRGVEVLATDQPSSEGADHWGESHCTRVEQLHARAISSPEVFARNVRFQPVDMNALPDDFGRFDFLWSSCSMEHLGDLEAGLRFVENAMTLLEPGGIAVHTTEYNVQSNTDTVFAGTNVIYRMQDIDDLGRRLEAQGAYLEQADFDSGSDPEDHHVDQPPYHSLPHLKLNIDGFASTSLLLVIRKGIRTED